jgi:hypothetical protein
MKELPYGVETDSKHLHLALAWCQEKWGERWGAVDNREGTWCVFWGGFRSGKNYSTYNWHFETESQLLLFSLRWA